MTDNAWIETKTQEILRQSGTSLCPVDIDKVVQSCDIELHYKEVEKEVSGILLVKWPGKRILAVNLNLDPIRQRFTIAYILGQFTMITQADDALVIFNKIHPFTRAGEVVDENTMPGVVERKHLDSLRFASAILLPEPEIIQRTWLERKWDDGEITSLSRQYGVSEQLLLQRLFNLHVIKSGY
jgi:Zn-dependent peptidase ImmA (M78 family)